MPSELPSGWSRRTIEEITSRCTAGYWGDDEPNGDSRRCRVIRNGDVRKDTTIESVLLWRYFSEEQVAKAQVVESDVILVSSGAYTGNVARIRTSDASEPTVASNFVRLLRAARDVDGVFLGHLLGSAPAQRRFAGFTGGSAIPNLQADAYRLIRFPLPPLPEQKKIAAILSSVDEAIQATQAVIEQTQRVKEGLLQELLTRGIGHTRFKQTEIGEIPEGWEVRRLGEISVGGILNGIFKKREEFGDGVPLVNVLDCFTGPPVDLTRLERLRADEGEVRRFGVRDGDLLFIRSSLIEQGIGHSAIVRGLDEPTVFECHLMRVRPTDGIEPGFLYHYTKGRSFRLRVMRNAQTTTMTTLPQDGLGVLGIPVPPLEEQRQIARKLDSLDRQVEKHSASVTGFHQVKAGLLQDLLTGKVRVSA